MIATHRRIVRDAECYQWNGDNTQEIVDFLGKHGMVGSLYRDKYLSVRADGFIVHTMWPGSLVIEGEDHEIRFYSDEKFRTMYRLITAGDELERLRAFAREIISYDSHATLNTAVKYGLVIPRAQGFGCDLADSLKVPE